MCVCMWVHIQTQPYIMCTSVYKYVPTVCLYIIYIYEVCDCTAVCTHVGLCSSEGSRYLCTDEGEMPWCLCTPSSRAKMAFWEAHVFLKHFEETQPPMPVVSPPPQPCSPPAAAQRKPAADQPHIQCLFLCHTNRNVCHNLALKFYPDSCLKKKPKPTEHSFIIWGLKSCF